MHNYIPWFLFFLLSWVTGGVDVRMWSENKDYDHFGVLGF